MKKRCKNMPSGGIDMGKASCSRCARKLGDQGDLQLAGICDDCWEAILLTNREELSAYLEKFKKPAVLVDNTLAIRFHNSRFRRTFTRRNHGIVGLRLGETLECAHAAANYRCGESPICFHCAVKRVVEIARVSGEILTEIGATYSHKSGLPQTFKLTAKKTGEEVLLILAN
jgi:hypothetical protein